MLKVGIFRSSSIGDVVLATSCLHLLKSLSLDIQILWIGKEPSLSLIRDAFPSVNCLELTGASELTAILESLKDVDILVDLQTTLRSRFVMKAFKKAYRRPVFSCSKSYLQRGRLVLEGRVYGRRRLLPDKALIAAKLQHKLMSDALLQALSYKKLISAPIPEPHPFLEIGHYQAPSTWLSTLRQPSSQWVALACGGSYETKRAPIEVFTRILASFLKKVKDEGRPVPGLVLLGDSNDALMAESLLKSLDWPSEVLNLCGQIGLWENAMALKQALLLLSNDSSLSHIAEAVGTPALVLFGPTIEGFGFGPFLEKSRAYSSRLGCRPCSKHGKSACRYRDKLCFHEIPEEPIAQHMLHLTLT